VAGGVAANQEIRKILQRVAFETGTTLVVPPAELCTDNGAMITWAGIERSRCTTDTLAVPPRAAQVAGTSRHRRCPRASEPRAGRGGRATAETSKSN
jgi:N6-L-threonylcarbamoyladenine synthase